MRCDLSLWTTSRRNNEHVCVPGICWARARVCVLKHICASSSDRVCAHAHSSPWHAASLVEVVAAFDTSQAQHRQTSPNNRRHTRPPICAASWSNASRPTRPATHTDGTREIHRMNERTRHRTAARRGQALCTTCTVHARPSQTTRLGKTPSLHLAHTGHTTRSRPKPSRTADASMPHGCTEHTCARRHAPVHRRLVCVEVRLLDECDMGRCGPPPRAPRAAPASVACRPLVTRSPNCFDLAASA